MGKDDHKKYPKYHTCAFSFSLDIVCVHPCTAEKVKRIIKIIKNMCTAILMYRGVHIQL